MIGPRDATRPGVLLLVGLVVLFGTLGLACSALYVAHATTEAFLTLVSILTLERPS